MIDSRSVRRATAALVAITLTMIAVPAAALTGTTWSVEPTPSPPGTTAYFAAVSCTSPTFCMAVGRFVDRTGQNRLDAERWDGSHWTPLTVRAPSVATFAHLNSVSCTSAAACIAVGGYQFDSSTAQRTLGYVWDGTAWHRLRTLNPSEGGAHPKDALQTVSCATATSCMAVGFHSGADGRGSASLAERWDGTRWAVTETAGPESSGLDGVSCARTTECIAVGSAEGSPMAERWNGTAWALLPQPVGDARVHLRAVSCSAPGTCMAVGTTSFLRTRAELWDGSQWHVVATPNNSNAVTNELTAVTCSSPTACLAVGDAAGISYQDGTGPSFTRDLAMSWDGTAWRSHAVPVVPARVDALTGVSCSSAHACLAVGYVITSENDQLPEVPLAAGWDGATWTLRPGAGRAGTRTGEFAAISCVDAEVCAAVGTQYDDHGRRVALSEFRDSAGWRIVPVPLDAAASELKAVSCTAADACVAVGSRGSTETSHPVALRWDGTSWAVLRMTSPPDAAWLTGVSCTSSTYCAAVGVIDQGFGDYLPLLEIWSGGRWHSVALSLPPQAFAAVLGAISCPATDVCRAVGSATYDVNPGTEGRAFEVRLDGAHVTTNADSTRDVLHGVSCIAPDRCLAVGIATQTLHAVAETWDGTAWSPAAAPSSSGLGNTDLTGVSCAAADACVAVGFYSAHLGGPLIEAWDGSTWHRAAAAAVPGSNATPELSGVSCPVTDGCRAAGGTGTPYPVPLVETSLP